MTKRSRTSSTRSVIIGGRPAQRATRAELVAEMVRAEAAIRALASIYDDDIGSPERARLLRVANRMQRILLRERKK